MKTAVYRIYFYNKPLSPSHILYSLHEVFLKKIAILPFYYAHNIYILYYCVNMLYLRTDLPDTRAPLATT